MARPGAWESLGKDSSSARGLTRPTVSLVPAEDRSEASATALNLTTGGIGSINMSVDIDGTTYAGEALGASREGHGVVAASVQLPDRPHLSPSCLHTFLGVASF